MFTREFIFSEKRGVRIKRHLLFWLCWWVYFALMHAVQPMTPTEVSFFKNLPFSVVDSFLHMLPQALLTYPMLYFVLPRFILRSKYVQALLWTVLFILLSAVVNLLMIENINPKIEAFILPQEFLTHARRPSSVNFVIAVLSSSKGGLVGATLAVVIKLVKHWYLKEQRNLQLQKENTEAQLQLLTAQVHPHFLFNTLNNIYSKAQDESPGSAKMIMELSHILRFVLDEGKHPLVTLDSELQMIMDYINLEKLRYDDKLDLHVSMPSKTEDTYIAPLLLLPFVENCFKHGTSKMLTNPWINLKVELKGTSFFLKVMNGKKSELIQHDGRRGTGISNVRKRLDLLYKNRYALEVSEDEEVFVVNLTMDLVKMGKAVSVQIPKTTSNTAYV